MDQNILNIRFVLAIKDEGTTNERYKARFVAQCHRDRDKSYIIHSAVPVRIRSVRILLTIALMMDWEVLLEDTNQAYCQGSPLERIVYLHPHPMFCYPAGTVFLLRLPLYGLSDTGDAWNQ